MLKRARELWKAIDLFHSKYKQPTSESDYNLSKDRMSETDWMEIDRFLILLRPFVKLTKRLEGNANKSGHEGSHGAIWETFPSMVVIGEILTKAKLEVENEEESVYREGVIMGGQKLNEYWDLMIDETPVYAAAVILHPELKLAYFKDKWRNYPEWHKKVDTKMNDFFKEYVKIAEDEVEQEDDVITRPRKLPQRLKASDQDSEDEFQMSLIVDEEYSSDPRARKKTKLSSELNNYYADGLEDHGTVGEPLTWWIKGQKTYPTLAKMAFDLYSIPAMSSECERVFSQTKKLITDERNNLGAAIIEAEECQKQWLRHGVVQSGRKVRL